MSLDRVFGPRGIKLEGSLLPSYSKPWIGPPSNQRDSRNSGLLVACSLPLYLHSLTSTRYLPYLGIAVELTCGYLEFENQGTSDFVSTLGISRLRGLDFYFEKVDGYWDYLTYLGCLKFGGGEAMLVWFIEESYDVVRGPGYPPRHGKIGRERGVGYTYYTYTLSGLVVGLSLLAALRVETLSPEVMSRDEVEEGATLTVTPPTQDLQDRSFSLRLNSTLLRLN